MKYLPYNTNEVAKLPEGRI